MAMALVLLAFGFVMFCITSHEFSLLKYVFGDISIVCSQIDGGVVVFLSLEVLFSWFFMKYFVN